MNIFNLFRRCCFCGKKQELVKHSKPGIYCDDSYYYHLKCLKNVLKNPDKHKLRDVDMAIDIVDTIKEKFEKEEQRMVYSTARAKESFLYLEDR